MFKVIKLSSPNHFLGRSDKSTNWSKYSDIVVCHQSGGTSAKKALDYYMNPNSLVCPHALIDIDGTRYELINLDNGSYCNGTQTTKPFEAMYYKDATNDIVKNRKANANLYTYTVEFVHCAKGDITEKQIESFVEWINKSVIPHMKKNGVNVCIDRDHIIGHCEINPKNRSFCPGPNFPYNKIIELINYKKADICERFDDFKVGQKVTIKSTAMNYAGTSVRIPNKYKGPKMIYTIDKVSDEKVLIKELYSWVYKIDLSKKEE